MIVKELMKTPAGTCTLQDDLASAARVMRERQCGFVPIVDAAGTLAGVLTDRDACLYASSAAVAMSHASVRDAMVRPVVSCFVNDNVKVALSTMAKHHVRRLPVLDTAGHLQGVLSIDDVIQAPRRRGAPAIGEIVTALREITTRPGIQP